jgi:hypothetical protein
LGELWQKFYERKKFHPKKESMLPFGDVTPQHDCPTIKSS